MNVVARHRIMGIEDFLSWESRQETKYEFDGYEPVAMVGGSENHARILRNLAIHVGGRLRNTGCEFFGSDLKVLTSTRVRYPDGQVVCASLDGEATFTTTPIILFEVTSPSSEALDHDVKAREYRGIASVRRYVILEQSRVSVTVWSRDDEGWSTVHLGTGDELELPEVGIIVPLNELYEGVVGAG